jgi:hypothetical protein
MGRQAVIHQLKDGTFRVVDVPNDWNPDRDLFPNDATAKIHRTEEKAVEDWKARLGLTQPVDSD